MLATDDTELLVDLISFVIDALLWVIIVDTEECFVVCREELFGWLTLETSLSRNVLLLVKAP